MGRWWRRREAKGNVAEVKGRRLHFDRPLFTQPLEFDRWYILEIADSYAANGNILVDGVPLTEPVSVNQEARRNNFAVIGSGHASKIEYRSYPGSHSPIECFLRSATEEEEELCSDQLDREGEELKLRREEVERQLSEACEKRRRQLASEFGSSPQYEREDWLKRYAERNVNTLLKERKKILQENARFHDSELFIEWLKENSPHLYERAQWRVRALAFAEELVVGELPRKASVNDEGVRERIVGRFLRGIKDEKALREALIEQGITDDDQIAQYLSRFRRQQRARAEGGGDGTEKLG